ncbi:hypothetical protein [Flavobacterium sp.]|uniref:hypothetical protein n=1 Tax=Flavobacterium sp. TaxID=239 RepID=UPI00260FE4DF|nr:hypothetical protein [Flavobacterium sp.]MDD2984958.1 hypothetical protein [Flavobacterium sp.]
MRKIFVLIVLFLVSCAPKESFQQTFPIPIKDYFYSKSENQLVFTVEFEKAIPSTFVFEKLYFRGKTATNPELKFNQVQFKIDTKALVLDGDVSNEYGNQPPLEQNLPFNLTPAEAVLTYKINNQVQHYKFKKVVERANF